MSVTVRRESEVVAFPGGAIPDQPTFASALPLRFRPDDALRLRYYVYHLVDPTDGETFYVGKGKGDRVFQHLAEAADVAYSTAGSRKLQTIRALIEKGTHPVHRIIRWGMDESAALALEKQEIGRLVRDVAKGGKGKLWNKTYGTERTFRLPPSPAAVLARSTPLSREPFLAHHVLFVICSNTYNTFHHAYCLTGSEALDPSRVDVLWQCCRGIWRRNASFDDPRYLLACVEGIILEVFEKDSVEEFTRDLRSLFPEREFLDSDYNSGRVFFSTSSGEMRLAPVEIRDYYRGRSTRPIYRSYGSPVYSGDPA